MLEDLGYLFSKIYAWIPKTEKEIGHMMLIVHFKSKDAQRRENLPKSFCRKTQFP